MVGANGINLDQIITFHNMLMIDLLAVSCTREILVLRISFERIIQIFDY